MKKIITNEKKDKEYYEVIDKFNDFLNVIFFDKDGNFSEKQYIVNKSNIEKFRSLYYEMNKFKVDPLEYFGLYKKEVINPKIESLEKEGKHEKILLLIKEKINLISNNLFKLIPTFEIETIFLLLITIFN
jgi:hypothetical protein